MKGQVLSTVLALAATGALAASSAAGSCGSEEFDVQFSTVKGYFLQDDPSTQSSDFDYASWNFGLLNRTYPTDATCASQSGLSQWQRFARWVDYLNNGRNRIDEDGNRVSYRVVFFGRHGEGWHNAAESFYGTPAWNCYYGELDGNSTASWADALLTDDGFAQARKANAYYKKLFEEDGLPYFESYYSSPLRRCIQTANTTFATLDLPATHRFEPVIKELFREGISVHTCDRRSNKTDIHAFAPQFRFEEGFAEQDPLWHGALDEGETSEHQLARSNVVLSDVFLNDESTWISVTSHSGEIGSMMSALGHQPFGLATGQIIPVFIKVVLVPKGQGAAATGTSPANATMTMSSLDAGFTHEALCNAPPVTSISGKGCVCSGGSSSAATPATTSASSASSATTLVTASTITTLVSSASSATTLVTAVPATTSASAAPAGCTTSTRHY
ncbi:Phosphomutase-like protein 3 [Escovopsis weberi]|uniref:Phosphomutase-like protein 3 n=1 Tax=Escovopsis weberi TaxID=150374 RepID=A0A0M8N0K8_ESCWE|nr:Phosphomutase-like protein 3 [Escovopsis weberi]